MKRAIFDIILFISIYIFPWWVTVLLLLIGIFIFDSFYEFMIFNVVIFALYSASGDRVISSLVFFPIIIITIYAVIQYIKNNMIIYKNKTQ
ncbi:MAG: hypothetical protein NTU81_02890 [Candidatus Nomurabacteria bacterium]|nr:hypothetical protein [Candidatus Nomurabacteria bacterium]